MKFDARKIRLLAAGAMVSIDDHPGLRIHVSGDVTKRYTWIYRYRSPEDGKLRQIKLGEWNSLTYPQAITAWDAARTARDSGVDVAKEKKKQRQGATSESAGEASAYTVSMLRYDYLESIGKKRSAAGLRSVSNMLRRLLEPLDTRAAGTITRADAYSLIEKVADETPSLAIKLKSELAQAWDFGIDSGKLPEETANHWRNVFRGKLRSKGRMRDGERTTEKRVLTAAEVGALLGWLPRASNLLADVLTLYLWTGARGGELVQMEGSEVREEDGVLWWTCPKRKTKNAKRALATDYRVPLFGRAAAIVTARKQAHGKGYLFPSEDGAGFTQQGTISEAAYKHQPYSRNPIQSGLTVTHWSPHDLRRTARTMLAEMKCPHEIGEAVLGHIMPGVAGVYNRYSYGEEKLFWLAKLDAYLESL
ncbi:integrase [Paraburkholderia sp. EB58]|uniref:tyrosine-type recombinase/integrase n=1 Tax=Paraburkholderia sp. EB58 TaxID=3035125 RepID=UPI003D2472AE